MSKDLSLKAAKAILRMDDSDLGANARSILNNSFEGKEVRTFGFKGEVCFVAKDVVELLGYKNSSKTIGDHCRKSISLDELIRGNDSLPLLKALNLGTNGKKIKIIKQGDVLRLIVKSKLPNAEKIESWIFDDVIPKVLDTGSFSVNNEKDKEILKLKAMLKSKDAEIDRVRQSIEPDTLAKVIDGNGQHIYRVRRSTMAIHTLEEFSKKVREKRDEDLAKQNSLYQSFMNEKNAKYTNLINGVRQNANRDLEIIQRVINSISTNSNDPFICNELHNYKQNCIKRANEIKRMKDNEIAKLSNSLAQLQNHTLERHQTRIHTINENYAIGMEHTEEEYNRLAREKYEIALRIRESNDTNGLEAQLLLQLLAD